MSMHTAVQSYGCAVVQASMHTYAHRRKHHLAEASLPECRASREYGIVRCITREALTPRQLPVRGYCATVQAPQPCQVGTTRRMHLYTLIQHREYLQSAVESLHCLSVRPSPVASTPGCAHPIFTSFLCKLPRCSHPSLHIASLPLPSPHPPSLPLPSLHPPSLPLLSLNFPSLPLPSPHLLSLQLLSLNLPSLHLLSLYLLSLHLYTRYLPVVSATTRPFQPEQFVGWFVGDVVLRILTMAKHRRSSV